MRTEFICIIWTVTKSSPSWKQFLRTEFICIIWTWQYWWKYKGQFLRTEFICIIWTSYLFPCVTIGSWGLNLFVLFELFGIESFLRLVLEDWIYLYYLNIETFNKAWEEVLEDWIYLYYLNRSKQNISNN